MCTKEEVVAGMKVEIAWDISIGLVPADIGTFSELHDHVDANCYGGFCEDVDIDVEFVNECQSAVDEWLRSGRP